MGLSLMVATLQFQPYHMPNMPWVLLCGHSCGLPCSSSYL